MKCPIDAEYYYVSHRRHSTCTLIIESNAKDREEHPRIMRYMCTRPKEHTGKHHDHEPNGDCHKTWTTEEAIIEAL